MIARKERIKKGMNLIQGLLEKPDRLDTPLLKSWILKLFVLVDDEIAGRPEPEEEFTSDKMSDEQLKKVMPSLDIKEDMDNSSIPLEI